MKELDSGFTKGACTLHLWCSIYAPTPNYSFADG